MKDGEWNRTVPTVHWWVQEFRTGMPTVLARAKEGISASCWCLTNARRTNVVLENARKERERKRRYICSSLFAFSQGMSPTGSFCWKEPESHQWISVSSEEVCLLHTARPWDHIQMLRDVNMLAGLELYKLTKLDISVSYLRVGLIISSYP